VQNAVEKLFGLWGQAAIFCTEIFGACPIRDCRSKRFRRTIRITRERARRVSAPQASPVHDRQSAPAATRGGAGPRRGGSDAAANGPARRRIPGLPNGMRRRRRASFRRGRVSAGHRSASGFQPEAARRPEGVRRDPSNG
jgi:hypothetical protein